MDKEKWPLVIGKIRTMKPLVYNITNNVVSNFTANGLLAIGASPVMAIAPQEAACMASKANALVLNIGTLDERLIEAMLLAGKSANEHGIPVVLDPVGIGATSYRTETVRMLLRELKVDIIRGNAAEIGTIAGNIYKMKGVDSTIDTEGFLEVATEVASKYESVVVVTGKRDIIADSVGDKIFISNGHAMMTKVTGTGCLLSAVIGAAASVEKDYASAATAALTYYNIAGEKAARKAGKHGTGSFQVEFINELSNLSHIHWIHEAMAEEVIQS
ncbi:hydroxyethylthiazole kinase [Bacillus massilinigeriensis]|uniref:hydroxyethylthiazole kinase n=1 Tax=Bacillus mediterraneensis TaxID=1805474 RepID=UPI0008F9764A|nr:hydroxyethylthiazole kinase [Bacillus mediterraneensis]